jgi:divalent metal cation (Fe/Co/Zn/Cd) transporter
MRFLLTPVKLVLALVAVVAFGVGVPFFWVWLGSLLQGGTTPSLTGLGVALVGIAGSYALLTVIFAWVKERVHPTKGPVRHDWNRSLSAERIQRGQTTTAIEDVVVAATLIVGIICTFWFFLFGDPGVPVA